MRKIIPWEVDVHLLVPKVVNCDLNPRLNLHPQLLGSQEGLMRESSLESLENVSWNVLGEDLLEGARMQLIDYSRLSQICAVVGIGR